MNAESTPKLICFSDDDVDGTQFFCPACGTELLVKESEGAPSDSPCPHLLFTHCVRHFPFAASDAAILPNPCLISRPNCDSDENGCL